MSDQLSQEGILKIIDYCKLAEGEAELIRKYIKHARVEKKMIRDFLSEQGKQTRRAYLLLEGNVSISANLNNGEKAVLSQVGKEQLLNLEIVLANWINQYTINVSSSFVKYITFEQREVRILAQHITMDLQQKIARRQKEVSKRNKQIKQASKRKKMEDNINKLILPEISSKHKKSLITLDPTKTQQITSIQDLPLFSKELKKQGRSSSLSQLKSSQSRYSEPLALASKNMDEVNQKILSQFHQQKDKIVQRKLDRLKSERSISVNEKQMKQYDYSRNQKLFKENLKNIVKRKLMFERKHFKILSNFKNDKRESVQQQIEILQRYEDSPDNPIDNYFLL